MNTGKIVFGPTHNMLGFESLFDELDHFVNSNNNKNNGYPPYNLSRVGEDQYLVEIAVAGFSQDELEIFVKDGYLTVKGEKVQKEDTGNYHRLNRKCSSQHRSHIISLERFCICFFVFIDRRFCV